MRLSRSLILFLLPFAALAAKKPAVDRFTEYHSKQLTTSPITLDDYALRKLTELPRNHTIVALFTAENPKFGCKLCQEFAPEWDLLARSWVNADKGGQNKIVLGTLDFTNGKDSFAAMNLMTAPVVFLYHPSVGPNAKVDTQPQRFDFTQGPTADVVQNWLVRQMPDAPIHPKIRRPFNYTRALVITTVLLTGTSLITFAYPYIVPIISHRTLWATGSVLAILLFTSGHMFNQIRGAPYIAGNGKGGINYFASGFQSQYGLESQIVAATYAVLAFATVALGSKVPRIKDPRTQQAAVFVWLAVTVAVYSWLLNVFRLKNGTYPFWLPPF